jgi:hypothetical protein
VCYKKKGTMMKSIPQIQKDIETALRSRNLQAITISGGEPTLHPELCNIVTMIKQQGLHVFLLTNGVLIDEDYIGRLKKSGLDSILFHVDMGQKRPDLPDNPKFSNLQLRLTHLIELASSHGLDVSISLTLYDNDQATLDNFNDFFFKSKDITFLFIAHGIDPSKFPQQLIDSIKAAVNTQPATGMTYRTRELIDYYRNKYDIVPFAFLPASDGKRSVWASYFIPIIYTANSTIMFKIQPNLMDAWLLEIPKILTGHYIHKTTQNTAITLFRVIVNGITTFRLGQLMNFVLQSQVRGNALRHKIIVYDDGPIIEKGKVIACMDCPNAIVRDGKILRGCTSDYVH